MYETVKLQPGLLTLTFVAFAVEMAMLWSQ